MRPLFALVLIAIPGLAFGQTKDLVDNVEARLATLKYINGLQDPATGGFKVTPDGKPSLRACNGAVRAIRNLAGMVEHEEKVKAFVLSCYDTNAGAFHEPGGMPDVTINSIGIMAAVELELPKAKYARALDYLNKKAKTFEDVRIAAAAVEAYGVKQYPHELGPWFKIGQEYSKTELGDPKDGGARMTGSLVAMMLRLGQTLPADNEVASILKEGQRADGGWGKAGDKASDLESTYRVMRALVLMKQKPDAMKLNSFLLSCRNADGGYGVKPGEPSSMSGVYYATSVIKWNRDK